VASGRRDGGKLEAARRWSGAAVWWTRRGGAGAGELWSGGGAKCVDVCGWEWCVGVGFQWGSQLCRAKIVFAECLDPGHTANYIDFFSFIFQTNFTKFF